MLSARLAGRRVIASISGGKDSAAMSLWLHEQGIDHDRVFLDTGWESDVTYEYLRTELARVIGPITWVTPSRQMEALILHKGMFPGRRIRFCTEELKVLTMQRYLRALADAGGDFVNTVGVRAAESAQRSALSEWEWQDAFDCEVWRPLLAWTEAQVIEIHKRHGLRPNPLYLLGARRVGCWPCIHASKTEIRLIADTDPQRIDRVRQLEAEVAVKAHERWRASWTRLPIDERINRRGAGNGLRAFNPPAFFQSPIGRRADGRREGRCWPIDDIVAWSRTVRGGVEEDRQENLFAGMTDGCMRWGLCEQAAEFVS